MKLVRKPTQQDVTWFLDLYNSDPKKIDLDPSYQRKSVWSDADRAFFLDTVLNNFPCPPIFLHKDIEGNGKVIYRVIDGKQRLSAIFSYANGDFAITGDEESRTPYSGKKFSELSEELKMAFWNYMVPVEMVNPENVEIVKSIFDRLNRNNKKLNNQELRKAKYDGKLQTFIERESEDNTFWGKLVKFSKRDISRMADHQFISEIVMLIEFGKVLGFSQDAIDQYYADNDVEFSSEAVISEKMIEIKDKLIEINSINQVIEKNFGTRAGAYTIWSIFSSTSISGFDSKDLAIKLKKFADDVENVSDNSSPEVREYFEFSRGATTDKSPREKRLSAMKKNLGL